MSAGADSAPIAAPIAANHAAAEGPIAQSLRLGFAAVRIGTLALALVWLGSNIRQVPPEMQALVLRFGKVVRVQQAGLVLAWPRPIEQVALLPGPQRQYSAHIAIGTAGGAILTDPASALAGELPPKTAGVYLSGDGGVVLLDITLAWHVADPVAYRTQVGRTQVGHIDAALRRLSEAASVAVIGARGLDDILSARGDADPAAQARRAALRADLAAEINRRLAALARSGGGYGVEISRVDLDALLPPAAKFAFDSVLEASQMAEQGRAAASIDATRAAQAADQQHDKILADARAAAAERVARARSTVAEIDALRAQAAGADRQTMLNRLYRDRIAAILAHAGAVTSVDDGGAARLILPASRP
jgi:modulator of FtsH protease HflK